MSYQIAIDGPAGAGKSTIARLVAAKLGYIYVDTGAMYRAMGLFLSRKGIDLASEEAVSAAVGDADIRLEILNGTQHVFLGEEDVSTQIRTEEAGMNASKTSAYPAVRERLVAMQQQIANVRNVVMDGRDIGTVVLPKAPLKIYLTASVATRARRRYEELTEKGQNALLADIEKDIAQRDEQDMNRKVSPLRKAEDAVLVDSSDMTIEEVVNRILSLMK